MTSIRQPSTPVPADTAPPSGRAARTPVPLGIRIARVAYAAIPLGMVAVLVLGSFI